MLFIFSGDATNSMHLQNLQGLAALANATNNPGMPTVLTNNHGNILATEHILPALWLFLFFSSLSLMDNLALLCLS